MNKKKFSDAMSEIDDKYYVEASEYLSKGSNINWVKFAAAVAVLAIVVFATFKLFPQKPSGDNITELPKGSTTTVEKPIDTKPIDTKPIDTKTVDTKPAGKYSNVLPSEPITLPEAPIQNPLPKITYRDLKNNGMGLGPGGLMAYDASELVNSNPWNKDMVIDILPVYKAPYIKGGETKPTKDELEYMRILLLKTAKSLGVDLEKVTITDDVPSEEQKAAIIKKVFDKNPVPEDYFDPAELRIDTNEFLIKVSSDFRVFIDFKKNMKLPDDYKYRENVGYDDAVKIAEYLKSKYNELLGFKDTKISVESKGYNIYLEKSYRILIYESLPLDVDTIVSYNLRQALFSLDYEDGTLSAIFIENINPTQKVGDYPIITIDRATELFKEGKFISASVSKVPDWDTVKKIELIYLKVPGQDYILPYYEFTVQGGSEPVYKDLLAFPSCYVPAIEPEFIEEMEPLKGNFNR